MKYITIPGWTIMPSVLPLMSVLPLVRVSPTFHQLARGGRFVFCPEIGTFLSYIKNARYMLTDSFHGTAFAINFHTPFLEVLPNNKTGARNQSILQLTGLEDRLSQILMTSF